MTVRSGRNALRRIPGSVKRAATHANRSRWLRVRGVEDGRLQGVPVPVPVSMEHVTRVSGSGEAFHATCSCGEFATSKPTAERYARGAATRHLNTVSAARDGTREVAA